MSNSSEDVETSINQENLEKKTKGSKKKKECYDNRDQCETEPKLGRKSENAISGIAQIQKQNLRKILDMPFIDNDYPKHSFTPVARKFLEIDNYRPKAEETTGRFTEETDRNCVICHKSIDSQGDDILMACHGFMNGASRKTACKSKFHANCMIKYNSSSFLFQYSALPECQNKLLCPLHCCAACNVNHLKQSAYQEELHECTSCLRSFHKNTCVPAGAKLIDVSVTWKDGEVGLQMLVCPSHAVESKTGRHLKACHDCEDTERLVECATCVRSFHPECQEVQTIDGLPIPANRCEMCLSHDVIRLNVPVLVRWKKTQFYIAVTRDWLRYPNKQRGSCTHYETVGHVVVEWINESDSKNPLFSVVAVNDIAELVESYLACAKPSDRKFWTKTLRAHDTFQRIPPVCKEVNRMIQTSRHVAKFNKWYYCPETGHCGCKGAKRCTTDDCIYVADGCECPPACSKLDTCHNRNVSDKKRNANIEQRAAGAKGFGVFATGAIKKGDFIAEYAGEIINKTEKDRRLRIVALSKDFQANHYMMDTADGMTVDAARAGNIARYINHSCDPNAGSFTTRIFTRIEDDNSLYEHRVYVKAIRDIECGEEVTFDYGMGNDKGLPLCRCGAANCTGSLSMKAKEKEVSDAEEPEDVEDDEDEEKEVEKKGAKKARNMKRKAESKNGSPPSKRSQNEPNILDSVENILKYDEPKTRASRINRGRRKSTQS